MVSSVAGRFAPPFLGAYVASKHGLEGMSASLRRELMLFGIDVIIVGAWPLPPWALLCGSAGPAPLHLRSSCMHAPP